MSIKKLWGKVVAWFVFSFNNPVLFKQELGGFKVVFRRYWMEIRSLSDNFRLRVMVSEHPYGYLFYSMKKGLMDNIKGFCHYVYALTMSITTDQKLANEIQRSLNRSYDRRAKEEMAKTAKERDDETAINEVMANHEMDKMPRKERRKIVRELRNELKKSSRNE